MTMTNTTETPRPLLNAKGAGEFLGIATGTVYNLRSAGLFAPAIIIGKGAVRWEQGDLVIWARKFKEGQTPAQLKVAGL